MPRVDERGGAEKENFQPADRGTPQLIVPTGGLTRASKVDLLFVIDNSASMGDKQELLRQALPSLITRLVRPNCVDPTTRRVLGPSAAGACATGSLEFAPVHDLHVGFVTSSLGGQGGDTCDACQNNPFNSNLSRHNDDRAWLVARAGDEEAPVPEAPDGFLAFGPGGLSDVDRFQDVLQSMVAGVNEFGCGIEAPLESAYRFLIDPMPPAGIRLAMTPERRSVATYEGIDDTILKQRKAFLRPDSLVVVTVVTDEDDASIDPLSMGGQGWVYANRRFLGSVGGGAARATSTCRSAPSDPSCTTCALLRSPSDPDCQLPGDLDPASGLPQPGYYPGSEDSLNTRFFRMKTRYGIDPRYPVSRYVRGFSSAVVSNRGGTSDCVNPLYAAALPGSSKEEVCQLAAGPRSAELVLFAVLGGVGPDLVSTNHSATDWRRVLGQDLAREDFTGIDPHMFPSIGPREGLPGVQASNDADPIHGRERETDGKDLQYACTFSLPKPRDCEAHENRFACDCMGSVGNPVCASDSPTIQTRAKAYPSLRPLAVARALGDRARIGSICGMSASNATPRESTADYRPAMTALADRMAAALTR